MAQFDSALEMLKKTSLLTGESGQEIRDTLLKHPDPVFFADLLIKLQDLGLLTEKANRDAILNGYIPSCIKRIIPYLIEANLLTGDVGQKNFKALLYKTDGVAAVLYKLALEGLLIGKEGQNNFDAVIRGRTHNRTVIDLAISGLLTGASGQSNFNAIFSHKNPAYIGTPLRALRQANLLTGEVGQARFNQLMSHSAILWEDFDTRQLWATIPPHQLTAARFDRIIQIAVEHQDNPTQGHVALANYVNQLLHMGNEPDRFNPNQSTHTASVHKSVSESAIRLWNRYEHQLKGNEIQLLSDAIASLPDDSLKNKAAKSCIKRITEAGYAFTDPKSGISIIQLLSLFWFAIHDEGNRQGSLTDALLQLTEGLYEIQRGYNLSDKGIDDLSEVDRFICIAGTFNKIMEKLNGLHPDVQIVFITKEGCASKIIIVVNEESFAYLNTLNAEEIQKLSAQDDGDILEQIWPHICSRIADRMFDEYGSLFPQGKNSKEFEDYIAVGVDVGLNPDTLKALNPNRRDTAEQQSGYTQVQDTLSHPKPENEQNLDIFNHKKNNIQKEFINYLNALNSVLLNKKDPSNQESKLYSILFSAQNNFFSRLTPELNQEDLDRLIITFRNLCQSHLRDTDRIMGHGWLYQILEVSIKAVLGLFVGIGMILGSLVGQGLYKSEHRQKFKDTFFVLNKTDECKALKQFELKILGESNEKESGLLSKLSNRSL